MTDMKLKNIFLTGCILFAAHTGLCQTPGGGEEQGFTGKVLETTNTAGYTYIRIDTGKKKVWAAAPTFTVKVGDKAAIAGGLPMPNYHSTSMNRDFDVVYFTGNVVVNGVVPVVDPKMGELPKDHPPIGGASGSAKPTASAKLDFAGLKKAPGGKTVAEVFGAKEKLGGQKVVIRGKVAKYSAMIMGKNWIHLRDGTGSQGTDDLVVTTDAKVKVGDTILVTGNITLDKDFGAGYKYDVLIEDAKVVAE